MNELLNSGGDLVAWVVLLKALIVLVLVRFSIRSILKAFNEVTKRSVEEGFPAEHLTRASLWVLVTIFVTLGLFFFFGGKAPTINSMDEAPGHAKMLQEAPGAPTKEELQEDALNKEPDVLKRQRDPGAIKEMENVMDEVDKISQIK